MEVLESNISSLENTLKQLEGVDKDLWKEFSQI